MTEPVGAKARVAVIVPCHGDGLLALEAVESIREPERVETVVIDDASQDDETQQALANLERRGVRVVRHERNGGLAAARNTGLRESSASYVFPLDADDLVAEGMLSRMADRLDAAPAAGVCYGDYAEFGTQKLVRAVPDRLDTYRLMFTNEYPVSALFRRAVLEQTGGWSAAAPAYEDWNLWLTLAERDVPAEYVGAGVVTYHRRLHGMRMLAGAKRRHPELFRALRDGHPELYAQVGRHRRASGLSALRKLLYPYVYGPRRRFRFEPRLKRALDRLGIWTLRR